MAHEITNEDELDRRTEELLQTAIDPASPEGDRAVETVFRPNEDGSMSIVDQTITTLATPKLAPADMTTLDIAFELAHMLRGYQPISNQQKIEKRLKSLDMMKAYYEKRIEACTEEEQGLKVVFQHYLNAIKLSYANIVQLQKMIKTIKPYVDELNERRLQNGN